MEANPMTRSNRRIAGLLMLAGGSLLLLGAGPPSCSAKLSYTHDAATNRHIIYRGSKTLAVYNHAGNTFTEFWYQGVNMLGGFSSGTAGSNSGGAAVGHSADYPFGWVAPGGGKPQWEGFWAGFGYVDATTKTWIGVAGNPFAEQAFSITPMGDDLLDVHVTLLVFPLYVCDVHYYVSAKGIGVRSDIYVYTKLYPLGYDDTGGQFLMTQVDVDLDPAQPYAAGSQGALYYTLAMDGLYEDIDPFPPYNQFTPSNIYADQYVPGPPSHAVHPLPDTARVPMGNPVSYLTPLERPDRRQNLALRIDLSRSSLPDLEYYLEYNGERDYLNYLYSAAIGVNRGIPEVPAGTIWRLYGELRPWTGSDPSPLEWLPMLSDIAP